MNEDPSGRAAESARCAAGVRRRGEMGPRGDVVVHGPESTTPRRSWQVPAVGRDGHSPLGNVIVTGATSGRPTSSWICA